MTEPEWIEEVSKENKKDEIAAIVHEGIALAMEGKHAEAIKKYEEALEIMPDFTEAGVNMAYSFHLMNRHEEAVSILMKMLEHKPSEPYKIYDHLVDIYTKLNQTAEKEEYFKKSMAANPFIIDKLMKKGVYYFNIQDWHKALAAFESALQKRFDMKTYYLDMLATAQIRYEKEPEKAEIIRKLISEGVSDNKLNDYDSVLFNQILGKDKGLAENYNKTGYVYAKLDSLEKALPYFRNAIKVWPEYKDANNNIKYVENLLANGKK